MKNIKCYATLAFAVISLVACKKNSTESIPDPVQEIRKNNQDSISFTINERQYVLDNRYSAGIGNHSINIKSSSTRIPGGKLAYETGGFYWYGEKDSTLCSVSYGFNSEPYADFKISFTKKFKDSQLLHGPILYTPKNYSDIFKLGKQSFAVDLEKENTTDGISIDFKGPGINQTLTTNIPGFSILIRSGLKKDLQNNSSFEITKIEKIKDDFYLIEAKFEVNLFDNNEKLYRLEKGFLRLRTSIHLPGDLQKS